MHPAVQVGQPGGDAREHVAPPTSAPSHSSPASFTPFPHTGGAVVLVVDDVEDVELLVLELVLVVVVVSSVVLVVVVGGMPSNSYAPMSHTAIESPFPSTGRIAPRWSVAGHTPLSPASMAGLPLPSACVNVGPPLSASDPSNGS